MAIIGDRNKVCKEICDALGLKNCRKLDFHMEADKIVTIEAEMYPEIDGVEQFPAILKKFELVPIKDEKDEGKVA